MSDVMWAVSHGEYSDYSVMCICPTKHDAEVVAEKYNTTVYGEAFVESFPITTADVEPVVELRLSTSLWDDGTETETSESTDIEWPFDRVSSLDGWLWVRSASHRGKGGRLTVNGTDHEQVRKVYSDRRAHLIADPVFRAQTGASGRFRRAADASHPFSAAT